MNTSKKGERRKSFRRYLRKHTHWHNPSEFFLACLFECGAPPYPITPQYITWKTIDGTASWSRMADWRDRAADFINVNTHHWVDPGHIMQEYLKWLLREQGNNHISRL